MDVILQGMCNNIQMKSFSFSLGFSKGSVSLTVNIFSVKYMDSKKEWVFRLQFLKETVQYLVKVGL